MILYKKNVIKFFDKAAEHWDDTVQKKTEIIDKILDGALVHSGKDILDVACGTGVIIQDYLDRNVRSVTAIDISPEMVKIAKSKFSQEQVSIICSDIETFIPDKTFDCIVVYNALPNFADPQTLIRILKDFLNPGGTLTIAHGISREEINKRRMGAAKDVSFHLISDTELAAMFKPELKVIVQISDDYMYQVTGIK